MLSLQIGASAVDEAAPDASAVGRPASMHLPASMLSRVPKAFAVLAVKPPDKPKKKIDPKYDVSLIGHREIGKGLDFYSTNKEIEIGRQMAREVDQSVKLVDDPVITEYVNRLGQKLVRNSDARVPFTIKVIDDDQINAFALPGGFFYVNTGMILAADNEAGLAGVMAHEIAHVAARHATKNQTKSDIFSIASIPLVFFGGPAAMAVRQAMGLAVPMGFLKFSRDAEREADSLGMQYEYVTGYDPEEFVKLFEKLKTTEKQNRNILAKAFATHPMTDDRIKRAQKMIEKYLPNRDQYIVDTSEFQAVRRRVAELENRRQIDMGKVTPVLIRRGANEDDNQKKGGPVLRKPNQAKPGIAANRTGAYN